MSPRPSKQVTEQHHAPANQDSIQGEPLTREDTLRVIDTQLRQFLPGLHGFFRKPESAPEVLKALEEALQPLMLRGVSCADIASDVALRRTLSLLLGSEMQREESYTLADLHKILDRHVSKLPILFEYPAVARVIVASMLAPSLYPVFPSVGAGRIDIDNDLGAVISRLQKHNVDVKEGRSIFKCWQELAFESLVAGYGGKFSALTPQEFLNASRIAPHSVRLDAAGLDSACAILVESLQGVGGHPRALFEALHPDTRAEVVQRVNFQSVVDWLRSEMQDATRILADTRSRPVSVNGEHLSEGLWNSRNRASAQLKRLVDALRFFNLYHERIPRGAGELPGLGIQPDAAKSSELNVKAKLLRLRDLFQKELSRVSAELMEELALSFESDATSIRCEREFAFALAEFFVETSVAPDESVRRLSSGLQRRIFSWEQLLPGVERALASGDFESAANVRLLFPLAKAGYSVHDTVDEYIQNNQGLVIRALKERGSQLRTSMIQLVKKGITEFPEELQGDVLSYCQGMERFLNAESIGRGTFDSLVDALSPLARGLLAWDGIVERVRRPGEVAGRLPHPFQGSVVAATLVGILRTNPEMQRAIVKACWSLEGVSKESARNEVLLSRDALLKFVKVTDAEFQSARSEVQLHAGGSFDISYESERARRAQLLYDLAVDKGEQAIKTVVIPVELEIGSGIVRGQELRAARRDAPPSFIARHEQEMLRFLLEGNFPKGRPLGPVVERCRGAIEKGTRGAGPEEIRLEDSAFDMLVDTLLDESVKQVTREHVIWVRERLIDRFLAPFESRHYQSRRKMAQLLCGVLKSSSGSDLCTESNARAELVSALHELLKRKVRNEEDGLQAWRTFFDSAQVVAWRRRMGVS
jgi:hypothetical protein